MRLINIAITVKGNGLYSGRLITVNGNLVLPSFARFYLVSVHCIIDVWHDEGDPLVYQGSDGWGQAFDGLAVTNYIKTQGYIAQVCLRNENAVIPIIPQEVTYTPVNGTLDSLNTAIFINPHGYYIPKEAFLLNLNPSLKLGLQSKVRWAYKAGLDGYFNTSNINSYTNLILSLGCE